jgi:hypothetical protein
MVNAMSYPARILMGSSSNRQSHHVRGTTIKSPRHRFGSTQL